MSSAERSGERDRTLFGEVCALASQSEAEISRGRSSRWSNAHPGRVAREYEGTPQGGPLSPLLSNIVLDELDRELERRGHSFVRYADDCNIYVSSRRAAERMLAGTQRYVEEKLDGWMRRRLRQLSWKQWKRPGKRYQRLRELGVSKYRAIRAGGSSKGPWRMSKSPAVERALSK